jgi:hypothetical protein
MKQSCNPVRYQRLMTIYKRFLMLPCQAIYSACFLGKLLPPLTVDTYPRFPYHVVNDYAGKYKERI